MRVHQAVYGASSGHALLKASDETLAGEFRNLAWRTDLPQTCPNGVLWDPYFRLIRETNWIILIHTRSDDTSKRGGMVLSRAAFLKLGDVEVLDDLSPIAAIIASPWAEGDPLEPIEYQTRAMTPESQPPTSGARAIATALSRVGLRPIVTRQGQNLHEAMFEVWRRAPPEFRTKLTFGLSFGPDDVHDLSVVSTPEALLTRWNQSEVVDLEAPSEAVPHSATILDAPVDGSVRNFAKQVGLKLDSPTSITIAVQAFESWQREGTAGEAIWLLRVLVDMAAKTSGSESAKSQSAERVLASATTWTFGDVLSMRNLDFSALRQAQHLSIALSGWIRRVVEDSISGELKEVFSAWASSKPKQVWLDAVKAGMRDASHSNTVGSAAYLAAWQALSTDPARAGRLLSLFPDASQERRFLDVADKEPSVAIVNTLIPELLTKKWWRLAGALLARSRSPYEAVVQALALAPSTLAARQELLSGATTSLSDDELVNVAIAVQDSRVTEIAARACVRTPSVLKRFDWKRFEWFTLFKEAFSISPAVLDDLPDSATGLGQTIGAQMAVASVWAVVAATPLANMVDVSERARAWSLIPEPHVTAILLATARGWLAQFELGRQKLTSAEPQLAAEVTTLVRRRGYLIDALRRAPATFVSYIDEFGFSSDREASQFITDLNNGGLNLNEAASKALGQVIQSHQWTQVAKDAKGLLNSRPDLYPMYRECYKLLGPIDRLWISFKVGLPPVLTTDEAWEAFEAQAVELFQSGPWHDELWSRSGGRNEDLVREGSGRASWHRCVRDLRNGMSPGTEAVLREMSNQYYHNDTLRQLLRQRFWQ